MLKQIFALRELVNRNQHDILVTDNMNKYSDWVVEQEQNADNVGKTH